MSALAQISLTVIETSGFSRIRSIRASRSADRVKRTLRLFFVSGMNRSSLFLCGL